MPSTTTDFPKPYRYFRPYDFKGIIINALPIAINLCTQAILICLCLEKKFGQENATKIPMKMLIFLVYIVFILSSWYLIDTYKRRRLYRSRRLNKACIWTTVIQMFVISLFVYCAWTYEPKNFLLSRKDSKSLLNKVFLVRKLKDGSYGKPLSQMKEYATVKTQRPIPIWFRKLVD